MPVLQAQQYLGDFEGNSLILNGDTPLVKPETIRAFFNAHLENDSDLSVLTAKAPDPTGYGRIVRDGNGDFQRIKEEKDASLQEKKITEFNSGTYLVNNKYMFGCC